MPQSETYEYLRILTSPLRHKKATTIVIALSALACTLSASLADREFAVDGLVEVARPPIMEASLYVDPVGVLTYLNFVYAKGTRSGLSPYLKSTSWAKAGSNLLQLRMHASSVEEASAEISRAVEKLNEKFQTELNITLQPQLDLQNQLADNEERLKAQEGLLKGLEERGGTDLVRTLIQVQRSALMRDTLMVSNELRRVRAGLPATGTSVARLMETKVISTRPIVPNIKNTVLVAFILIVTFSLIVGAALDGQSERHKA